MFIILPKERFGLKQMLANMTGAQLLNMLENRDKVEVDVCFWELILCKNSFRKVVLPKFKLESTHDLNQPLINLGIRRAFTDSAQFGGITTEEPLKIDKVIQKAFIEVRFIF